MVTKYFEAISSYFGIIAWFIILIAAKISHVSTRKKLTRSQLVANILYSIIGGVMSYFASIGFQHNIRMIAVACGVLAGDVLVGWIPNNAESILDAVGDVAKKWLQKKK